MEKIFYKDKEYELVKKTMKIARMIDNAEQAVTVTAAYKAEYDLIVAVIGKDAAKEILGTSSLEEVDLNEVVKLYSAIIEGYDKEINEEQRRRDEEMFDSAIFDKIDKLAKNAAVISELAKK